MPVVYFKRLQRWQVNLSLVQKIEYLKRRHTDEALGLLWEILPKRGRRKMRLELTENCLQCA